MWGAEDTGGNDLGHHRYFGVARTVLSWGHGLIGVSLWRRLASLPPNHCFSPRFRGLILSRTVTRQQYKGMATFALIVWLEVLPVSSLGLPGGGAETTATLGVWSWLEGSWEAELWLGCCSQMEAKESPACGSPSSHLPSKAPRTRADPAP